MFLRVLGRGSWVAEHNNIPLLSVTDGHPTVPRERLDKNTFSDAVERIFGEHADVEELWRLALEASEQHHGTMLVIHANAENEARRLSPPAIGIKPGPLADSTLLAVSAIDGAILVDPAGHCHAVGTILDGLAVPGMGDASRGARFNSAHRYLSESNGNCLIVIVSEDGMLNLIPDLPRRVKRSYVDGVISKVVSLSHGKPVDFEEFFKHEKHLRSLDFYLSAEQCTLANESLERVEDYRESSAKSNDGLGFITRVWHDKYEPHSAFNDTFFLPE